MNVQGKMVLFHLGNVLIILALLGLGLTFYPVVKIYLFPPQAQSEIETKNTNEFSLAIPKIRAYSPVIAHVDPWNEEAYKAALQKGVAHAKGTSLPGKPGTIFLFAHSSGMPWQITRYNTIFLRLGELEKGDTIYINFQGELYTFSVTDKKEVWPNETQYLENTKTNQLILQTCTPIGTDLKRLLVFAKEKK